MHDNLRISQKPQFILCAMRVLQILVASVLSLLLVACGSVPPRQERAARPTDRLASEKGMDVVIFALGLIDTNYRFGGKNPEAGFDCSGNGQLHLPTRSADVRVAGSARRTSPVTAARWTAAELRPGDLVFFTHTRNAPYSHVGIYIGDDRFVHAPSTPRPGAHR
jgi:cell wall-associated NlpC family hydrolase